MTPPSMVRLGQVNEKIRVFLGVIQFQGPLRGVLLSVCRKRENSACGLLVKWKSILQKWVSWTANDPI